jgi:hypothetical protein
MVFKRDLRGWFISGNMVEAYWNVGRESVEKQGGASRPAYGDGRMKSLAARMTVEFGEGIIMANQSNMRQFCLAFQKCYTLRREFSWSHYRILMRIENEQDRDCCFSECVESRRPVMRLSSHPRRCLN